MEFVHFTDNPEFSGRPMPRPEMDGQPGIWAYPSPPRGDEGDAELEALACAWSNRWPVFFTFDGDPSPFLYQSFARGEFDGFEPRTDIDEYFFPARCWRKLRFE